jgi:hypothetical protein
MRCRARSLDNSKKGVETESQLILFALRIEVEKEEVHIWTRDNSKGGWKKDFGQDILKDGSWNEGWMNHIYGFETSLRWSGGCGQALAFPRELKVGGGGSLSRDNS